MLKVSPEMIRAAEPVLEEARKAGGRRAATVATLRAGLDAMVVAITDAMVEAYDEAEQAEPGFAYDQTRAGLRAALEEAGFTVAPAVVNV